MFVHPQRCYRFYSFQCLTRLRFGINRAKKLADIGFGRGEHGGALSRHLTRCLLVSLGWQVFEASCLSCGPHAILQTTLEGAMPSFLVFAN
jgi:hypothetical protein